MKASCSASSANVRVLAAIAAAALPTNWPEWSGTLIACRFRPRPRPMPNPEDEDEVDDEEEEEEAEDETDWSRGEAPVAVLLFVSIERPEPRPDDDDMESESVGGLGGKPLLLLPLPLLPLPPLARALSTDSRAPEGGGCVLDPPTCSSGRCRRILPPIPPIPADDDDEEEVMLPLLPPPMLPRPSFGMDTDLTVAADEDVDDDDDDESSPRRVTLARLSPSPFGADLLSCDDDTVADAASAKDEGAPPAANEACEKTNV